MIQMRSRDCPYCGIGHSNFCYVEYDNGHHCYSCGEGSSKSPEHFAFRDKHKEELKSKELYIPPHTKNPKEFDIECLQWLYNYYVYDSLITKHGIAYVEKTGLHDKSLLFPILNVDGQMTEFQRRFFPKNFYSSSGVKTSIFATPPTLFKEDHICIVEDYISAIRVAQHCATLCLFGTSMSDNQLSFVTNHYDNVIIWLDGDEPGIAASKKISEHLYNEYLRLRGKNLFQRANAITIQEITTKEQPKELSPSKINKIIGEI